MKNTLLHHVTRHAKTLGCHIHKHHKKYLFGIFGGFALVKTLLVFVAGFGALHYSLPTFADTDTGCVLTGQIYTGETQECVMTGGYLTGGQEDCTVTQEGYYTGGTLDESGNLVDQTYVEPIQECVLTGQYTTGEYEDCVTLSGYRTGGTLFCPETGNQNTGAVVQDTGSQDTGTIQTGVLLPLEDTGSNDICGSEDLQWISPMTGNSVNGIIPFQWSYLTTDCTKTGNVQLFTLQLFDHNQQWIPLTTVSSLATGATFDSLLLSGVKNASGLVVSGMYTVVDASGVVLFTGVATGAYTDMGTGYRVRLLDQAHTILYTGSLFTIDNRMPTLTGIQLASADVVSGYVGLGDEVTLTFTASEELSGLTVLIGGTGATLESKNGLIYTYTQLMNTGFVNGRILYTLAYQDLAGNTGATVTGSGNLIFDKTAPTVTSLHLTGTIASGITLSFTTNELARFTLNYQKSGSALVAWTGTDYQTGNTHSFTGVQASTGYVFKLFVYDIAHNMVAYSGSFSVSATGVANFQYLVYDPTSNLTGQIATLATTMKDEINKFNQCKSGVTYKNITLDIGKNVYDLQMPVFQKEYVKKIVNAFTLLVMDKVEKNKKLTQNEIEEITKKFNNFLIILKFVRDDDNACKQNLSTYHITQFTRAMQEYNLDLK